MHENPCNHGDGKHRDDWRSGNMERRAVASNFAPHQFQSRCAAKNVKQQHCDVREDSELLKC